MTENTTISYTDYLGERIDRDRAEVDYLLHDLGRVVAADAGKWIYEYDLKDHLGNVRVAFADLDEDGDAEMLQENHYYPFGQRLNLPGYQSSDANPYLYNGKELQEELGLRWYDYGARFYDQALGRFFTQDRFTEKYYSLTNYGYAANNPIRNIDINGDSIYIIVTNEITNENGTTTIEESEYYYGTDSDGNKGFIDGDGNLYNGNDQFISALTTGIDKLKSKPKGRGLVNDLVNSENRTDIAYGNEGKAAIDGSFVLWNPDQTNGIPDQSGTNVVEPFIVLGHEFAHVQDAWNGTLDDSNWGESSIPNAEKYSTHIENQIRAEHGIPLRTHYSINIDGTPNSATRVINSNGESLFYTKTYTTTIGLPVILGGKTPCMPETIQTTVPFKY